MCIFFIIFIRFVVLHGFCGLVIFGDFFFSGLCYFDSNEYLNLLWGGVSKFSQELVNQWSKIFGPYIIKITSAIVANKLDN